MATVTSSKRHLDITSTSLSTSSNIDVGAKLTIGTTDTNTSSTTALVLNSTEVEKRTLGSMAFEATSSYLSTSDVVFVLSGNDIEAGDSITLAGGLSYNATTNTLSQADNNTTYTAGTGLTLTGTQFSVTSNTYASASHNHDSRYLRQDGSGKEWVFEVSDEGNITGNKWYKIATVNQGNGGLHLRGLMSNHVEGFASQKFDIGIVGREGGSNIEIEITGQVDILHNAASGSDKCGIRVIQSTSSGVYHNFDVYVRTTRYQMLRIHLTKSGQAAFHTSASSVTTEPAPVSGGNVELDTSTLQEGNYVIDNSTPREIYHEGHKPTYSELGTMAYTNLTGTPTIPTNNNQLTNGAGYLTTETYTGTVTSVTVGTGLDVSNGTTTPSITLDLSELTDMTASVNTSQDELILLDNGAERRKLFSEIFGSAAYSNTSAFAAASHNHDSSYPAKSDSYISLFSNQWQDTPEAKYVTIALPYMSGSGSSGYYIFDVFGYRDIGSMDSLVNYRVYAHVRSNGTEENDVKFHVYTLHEAASEEFEFAYKVNAGSTTSVYIFIEEDYSGLEIFGIPVTEGSLNLTTSGMISISETAPTGTTEIVRQVAHPKVDSVAGTYGNTANGTKIDTITIDENGHVTNVATGATGNMTGFFVEDGDGTEVQINNANEWKFVEGTGIDINWTDTNTGNDSDPYDLTFAIKNNSIGIDQLNVTDGTNGQVLTTNGSGTLSFATVTSGTSYGWSLNGTDIESGDSISLAGGLSLSGSNGSYTLTQTDTTTNYYVNGLSFDTATGILTASVNGATNQTVDLDGRYLEKTYRNNFTRLGYGNSGSTRYHKLVTIRVDSSYDDYNATFEWTGRYSQGMAGIHVHSDNDTTADVLGAWYEDWNPDQKLTGNGWIKYTQSGDTVEVWVKTVGWREFDYILKDSVTEGTPAITWYDESTTTDTATEPSNLNSFANNNHFDAGYLTAHPSITEASSNLSNSGRTYIQSITLDSNGHVTGVSTGTETVTNTDTNTVTSVGVSGSEVTGTVTIAASGAASVSQSGNTVTISATDTDTVYVHPTGAGNKHIPSGGAAGQFLKYSSSGTAVWATPSYTTNTDTTYSAGSGLDLTSTTFSVEADLRDGITHVGKDGNNYIQFDSTNGRIDFYAGGTFVARLESDGDLHVKGDVIAFSDIFS